MYFVFGNYGNNTIAVIQWAFRSQLKNVFVVHVNTGMAAPWWQERVCLGQALAARYQYETVGLSPSYSFDALVKERKSFPSSKYQWCPTFLKALPFLNFLDEIDPECKATILLGSRRADSRARQALPEFVEESEHYGDRRLWYPLYQTSIQERNALIQEAGFEVLNHRSFECYPCIHSTVAEIKQMDEVTRERIAALEREVGEPMFHSRHPGLCIHAVVTQVANEANNMENFDRGCGLHYACGE